MQRIFIVYPRGDKTKLAFGIGFDYERNHYSLASRREFSYDESGKEEALELVDNWQELIIFLWMFLIFPKVVTNI